jgi:hypothetical protein
VQKARSIQKWFVEIGVEELDWSAQSPDLNPIDTIEMNWMADSEPGLIAQHQCLTALMALAAEWKQVLTAVFQYLVEYSSKGGTNSILMPMILE